MTYRKQFRIRNAPLPNQPIDMNTARKKQAAYQAYRAASKSSAATTSLLRTSLEDMDDSIEFAEDQTKQQIQRRLAARAAVLAEPEGRIHTRGHKAVSFVVSRDNDTYCRQHNTFIRHRHETHCHDRAD